MARKETLDKKKCVEEEQETLVSLQWPDQHEGQQTQRASKMDDATPPNTFTRSHTPSGTNVVNNLENHAHPTHTQAQENIALVHGSQLSLLATKQVPRSLDLIMNFEFLKKKMYLSINQKESNDGNT